jgi:hypothetical protein
MLRPDALPDELTREELAQSDMLVHRIFDFTPSDQVQLAVYEFLGMRGNRYLSVIEDLPSLLPGAAIVFYSAYLGETISAARSEDTPTDNQKQTVINRLVEIFNTTDLNTQFNLNFEASQEIKRIDPVAYARLKAVGVVIENAS